MKLGLSTLLCLNKQHVLLQAFRVLNRAANTVLTALSKSPYMRTNLNIFDSILDDPVLDPGKVASSKVDAIHYYDTETAREGGGCPAHEDRGLLTVIFADTDAGLQVRYTTVWNVTTELQKIASKIEKTTCTFNVGTGV